MCFVQKEFEKQCQYTSAITDLFIKSCLPSNQNAIKFRKNPEDSNIYSNKKMFFIRPQRGRT